MHTHELRATNVYFNEEKRRKKSEIVKLNNVHI
jgi:hypothetical protein